MTGNNGIGAFATNGGAIGIRNESITVDGNNPTGVKLNNSGVIQMYGGKGYYNRFLAGCLYSFPALAASLPTRRTMGPSTEQRSLAKMASGFLPRPGDRILRWIFSMERA